MTPRAVEHDTEPVTETRTDPEPDANDPQSWLAPVGVVVLDVVVLGAGLLGVVVVGAVVVVAAAKGALTHCQPGALF